MAAAYRLYRLRYRENAHQIWEYLLEWNAHLPFGVNWNLLQRHQDRLPFPPLPPRHRDNHWQLTVLLSGQPRAEEHEYLALHGRIDKAFPGGGRGVWHHAVPQTPENMGHGTWGSPVTSSDQSPVHEDVYQRPGDGDQIRHQARTGGWHSAKPLELRFLIDPGCCGDLSCWGCTDPVAIVAKRCYPSKIHLHLHEIGWT